MAIERRCIGPLVAASCAALALGAAVLAAPKAGQVNDPAVHSALLDAAAQYGRWERVGNVPKVAPALCAAPPRPMAELSRSDDAKTHGRKVYYLFAKNGAEYRAVATKAQPVGQVLVKESWVPREADGKPIAVPSDVKYGLFIAMKVGAQAAGADDGWVYGTVSPDGKTVTSAGRVQSCIECHASAPYDRLFGLHPAPPEPAVNPAL